MADAAALAHSTQAPAPRVVLDSNIWVDILIFDDAVARPIRAALEAGRLHAIISPACREELRRVLAYPQFAHRAVDTKAALAWVDRMTHSVADPEEAPRADGAAFVPRCKDRDDQKFLALADAANAAYLVSKDRAVLKLKRRMAKYCDVAVLPPKQFVTLVQLETMPLAAIPNQA
ncbi:putative toxin-antitoxin system toxin component, PIN family [Ralstonia sp. UBA689]|uniref:putative toxin-antitoxin system toxin component, PIN family n=1 Tax=Ralstonia sp. UBA689 TaxID=1947373 RepID=UPI0025D1B0B0|nr:putative toxin-antitoxin system toxin component, PIN family [Ralstonia sp. UBA689]